MVANRKKVKTIEEQMAEFEARLRRQVTRERLDADSRVRGSFDQGHIPTIHVSVGALTASRPLPLETRVSGD